MTAALFIPEIESALKLQGLSSDGFVGLLDAEFIRPLVASIVGADRVVDLKSVDAAVRAARSSANYAFVMGPKTASQVAAALGADANSIVAMIAVGSDGSPASSLRANGVMAVLTDATEGTLKPLLLRGLEFRALRALELAHRCEARRIHRREMELVGHPPETMTDDLNTHQPPPLPVGPISAYNLEEVSEAFERAYIDRVQHLCDSAREAAQYLDVSAATLARRLRKEGNGVHGG
ncbi:MAG: hypothetical protein U1E65_05970 [Myxococcota bacterium]